MTESAHKHAPRGAVLRFQITPQERKRWGVLVSDPTDPDADRLAVVLLSQAATVPANDLNPVIVATPDNGLDLVGGSWRARITRVFGLEPRAVLGRMAPVSAEELALIDAGLHRFLKLPFVGQVP